MNIIPHIIICITINNKLYNLYLRPSTASQSMSLHILLHHPSASLRILISPTEQHLTFLHITLKTKKKIINFSFMMNVTSSLSIEHLAKIIAKDHNPSSSVPKLSSTVMITTSKRSTQHAR